MSALICATKYFQHYKSGIFYEDYCQIECGKHLFNHAVLVVDYGIDAQYGDFWLIKNSWGTTWGEKVLIQSLILFMKMLSFRAMGKYQ